MQAHSDHLASAADAFLPHGFCYLWNPRLLWTHVLADVLIGLAYVAISATLIYLVRRGRREFPFQGMFVAFGLFIVACGATHFVEVYTLWQPAYWFSASVKVVTAAASVGTAILLPPLVPRVLGTLRNARLAEERRVQAESAERFRVLAEEMPQIVWTARPDGSVDYYNRRWHEYTGLPTDAGHGEGWAGVVHPDDAARTGAAWEHAVRTGQPYEVTHRVRTRDGGHRWLLSRAVPLRDGEGRVTRWLGSATDVDAQKRAEQMLRDAKDAAEAANRAKSDFLSTMSHELRTPLNAIAGYVDLLQAGVRGPLAEEQARDLERIEANQRHLLTLINDVLHYSRIEAGRLDIAAEEVRMDGMLAEMVALVEPQIRAAGLRCACDAGDPPPVARADRDRLRQILLNLLTNAIKFTPEGGRIDLSAEAGEGGVVVRVRDTGRGIPDGMEEKVFDPFVQVRDRQDRDPSRQGVGLGLAISRDLARAMGGDVVVESTSEKGTTFAVSLPSYEPAAAIARGGSGDAGEADGSLAG